MKPRARRSPHARYTPAGQDGIGHLELTRPEKLNATDDDSVGDLDRAATRAARDRKARAIIVRGLGRAFCTGIDLSALAGDRLGADWFRRWDVALAKIEAIPVATVAAIHGPCLGGGLQIILCCDLRVASADATFGLSAVRHGIIPGLATYRLPHLIGMGAAREMMLLGETWDAARAHRQGLVSRVVPLERLEATALDLATKLAANAGDRGTPPARASAAGAPPRPPSSRCVPPGLRRRCFPGGGTGRPPPSAHPVPPSRAAERPPSRVARQPRFGASTRICPLMSGWCIVQ